VGVLIGVPSEAAVTIWPLCLPFIEQYFTKSKEHRWNSNDLLNAVLGRDMQLWVILAGEAEEIETVVLTEIVNYPRVRECNVFMISGKMTVRHDWREVVEEVVEWAASQGCHYISSMARKGSEKAMGWEVRQTYIVRAV
jgi:hypothetical protein